MSCTPSSKTPAGQSWDKPGHDELPGNLPRLLKQRLSHLTKKGERGHLKLPHYQTALYPDDARVAIMGVKSEQVSRGAVAPPSDKGLRSARAAAQEQRLR
jgi:hypothetical protein